MVSFTSFIIGALVAGTAVWYFTRKKNTDLFKRELGNALGPQAMGGPKSTVEHVFDPFGTFDGEEAKNYPTYSAMGRIF